MKVDIVNRALILLGVTWIVVGTVVVFAGNFLLVQFGEISARSREMVTIAVGGCALLLVCWGAITIAYGSKKIVMNLNLCLASLVIASPVLMESTLRVGIAFGPSVFRIPGLYSNPFSDDDYYKLRVLWGLDDNNGFNSGLEYDPILGWAYKRTPENLLGVLADTSYLPEGKEESVLFYGDSFLVAGNLLAGSIPQQLGRLLPHKQVYNFGVPGYGLDQIYLRFKQSHHHFVKPIVLAGILTLDMDRCILKYRSGRPKPYFLIEQEQLVLRGVPVEIDNHSYLIQHPVGIFSYLGAALVQFVRYVETGASLVESQHLRGEIAQISKQIIEGIVREAQNRGMDLRFIIFVPTSGGGWRKAFLIREIEHWKIPYLDTETILTEAMPQSGNFSLYYDESQHHTELANGIIARAIAEHLL